MLAPFKHRQRTINLKLNFKFKCLALSRNHLNRQFIDKHLDVDKTARLLKHFLTVAQRKWRKKSQNTTEHF
jgi:hypothetical protein